MLSKRYAKLSHVTCAQVWLELPFRQISKYLAPPGALSLCVAALSVLCCHARHGSSCPFPQPTPRVDFACRGAHSHLGAREPSVLCASGDE